MDGRCFDLHLPAWREDVYKRQVCDPKRKCVFSGIPTFAPELFATVRQKDTLKRKQFVKGVEQIAQELSLIHIYRILTMYLNTIYLGHTCYGVKTAATTYFGKDVSQLDLAECAALVGLTNNPSIYDPYNHPDRVKERQEATLGKMLELGMITQEEQDVYKRQV